MVQQAKSSFFKRPDRRSTSSPAVHNVFSSASWTVRRDLVPAMSRYIIAAERARRNVIRTGDCRFAKTAYLMLVRGRDK